MSKKVNSFKSLRQGGGGQEAGILHANFLHTRVSSGMQVTHGSLQHPAGPVEYRPQLFNRCVMESGKQDEGQRPSLLNVLGSVLAGMFGVQSSRKREADFTHGKPSQYVIIGLLMTVVFILTVWGVVSLVMKVAGV